MNTDSRESEDPSPNSSPSPFRTVVECQHGAMRRLLKGSVRRTGRRSTKNQVMHAFHHRRQVGGGDLAPGALRLAGFMATDRRGQCSVAHRLSFSPSSIVIEWGNLGPSALCLAAFTATDWKAHLRFDGRQASATSSTHCPSLNHQALGLSRKAPNLES